MPTAAIQTLDSLTGVPAQEWDALEGVGLFTRHAYLNGLEVSGCVGGDSGWVPQFIAVWEGERLVAAMPLYLKMHSYGEYVFDWAWAEAYERSGGWYYPKLVSAVPFTPVTGARLLGRPVYHDLLTQAALTLAAQRQISSLHILFPTTVQAERMAAHGLLQRTGVQFHWQNHGYGDFNAFLGILTREKRKKISQERRRVREQGLNFSRLTGQAITAQDWAFFHACYVNTYRQHHSTPYLNLDFFQEIAHQLGDQALLVVARRGDKPVASALNFFDMTCLYGRYWGTTESAPGLHFETCYYQAIEFCIERNLGTFEGGAQGEHKLARGFLPVYTHSLHWVTPPAFAHAVAEFLRREQAAHRQYVEELSRSSPYKTPTGC